ncbi:hypothetical protein QZH41_015141, partial [Actinostola sp. cb2023]
QSRFTKCTICVHSKEQLRNSKLNSNERMRMTNMRKVHLMQQMAERRNYYMHGIKARLEPQKYLSLIMDGMDQNKTRVPHFIQTTKVDDGLWKLKTHITGVLVNSRSNAYAYVDVCEYPHDPNLTIHLILKALVAEQEKRSRLSVTTRQPCGVHRDEFAIRMEESFHQYFTYRWTTVGGKNKNSAVFAFLGLLVQWGVFRK